jgi:hypothetical protein
MLTFFYWVGLGIDHNLSVGKPKLNEVRDAIMTVVIAIVLKRWA